MSRTSSRFEGVAIMTLAPDRRRMSKCIIPTVHHEQAVAIADALQGVEAVEAIPCKRDFDVFGRIFWTNRVGD